MSLIPFDTWHRLECRCSWSDRGWWLTRPACSVHAVLIPYHKHTLSPRLSDLYGPFKP